MSEAQKKEEVVEVKEGTPPKDPPKETPKAEAKVTPKEEVVVKEKADPKKVSIRDDEEEIPDDATLIEMSSRQLTSRLNRHSKRQLKEQFGTDDVDAIKAKLARAAELEEKEEGRRRDQLSKEAKLEEDVKKEREARTAAEARLDAISNERIVEREEGRITRIAEKYVDSDVVEGYFKAYAKHLNATYSKKQLETLKDSELEKWWRELAEKKPKIARDYDPEKVKADAKAAKEKDEKRDEKKKVPLNNGLKEERPSARAAGGSEEKTMKPGQSNSMTTQESKAQAAKEGYRW